MRREKCRRITRTPLMAGCPALPVAALFFAISCLGPLEPDSGEPVEYAKDGRPLVQVSVKTIAGGFVWAP